MDPVALEEYVRSNISRKRYEHSRRTAGMAVHLAEEVCLDAGRAWQAGIAHDIARDLDSPEWFRIARDAGKELDPEELETPLLLHGYCGSVLLRRKFPLIDEAVLEAVRWHTTGVAGMGDLAKIIYIADYCEPGRIHIDDSFRREIKQRNLDDACLLILQEQFAHLKARGRRIAKSSLLLYDELLSDKRECKKRGTVIS